MDKAVMEKENNTWKEHFQQVSSKWWTMRNENVFTDVTVSCKGNKVGEQVTFSAHKLVLTSCSPFFYNVLTNEKKPGKGPLRLLDVDSKAFETILEFMYTGQLTTLNDNAALAIGVMDVANKLQMQLVLQHCCELLLTDMTIQNFMAIWDIATKYKDEKMKDEVVKFVVKNFTELEPKIDCFSSELLTAFLKSECGSSLTTDVRLRCILKWIEKRKPGVSEKAEEDLYMFVNFHDISDEFLSELSQNETIHTELPLLKSQLFKTMGFRLKTRTSFTSPIELTSPVELTFPSAPPEQSEAKREDNYLKMYPVLPLVDLSPVSTASKYAMYPAPPLPKFKPPPPPRAPQPAPRQNPKTSDNSIDPVLIMILTEPEYEIVRVKSYHVKTDTMEEFKVKKHQVLYESAVCFHDGRLYFAGGRFEKNGDKISNALFSFNLKKNGWKSLPRLSVPRYAAAAVILNDYLYVSGGKITGNEAVSHVERKHLKSADTKWETVSPMNVARYAHSMTLQPANAKTNAMIIVVGEDGLGGICVEKYDPLTDRWFNVFYGNFSPLRGPSLAKMIDKKILVIDKYYPFSVVACLDDQQIAVQDERLTPVTIQEEVTILSFLTSSDFGLWIMTSKGDIYYFDDGKNITGNWILKNSTAIDWNYVVAT